MMLKFDDWGVPVEIEVKPDSGVHPPDKLYVRLDTKAASLSLPEAQMLLRLLETQIMRMS